VAPEAVIQAVGGACQQWAVPAIWLQPVPCRRATEEEGSENMPLNGSSFLAVWHDIEEHAEAEYSLWHTVQHMPERVGIPGFLVGRRYVNWDLNLHRYFTLYEGDSLDVFGSAAYRERLDSPTEWTTRMAPTFSNFIRSTCETLVSDGRGVGGVLATLRLRIDDSDQMPFRSEADDLAEEFLQLPGIVGAHLGSTTAERAYLDTAESALRTTTGANEFDAVVMVEGIGRGEVEAARRTIESRVGAIRGIKITGSAIYDLAYLLTAGSSR